MNKMHFSDLLIKLLSAIFIFFFTVACLLPFILVISSSLTDEVTLLKEGYRFLPLKFSLEAYRYVFKSPVILNAYWITIFVTVVGTTLSLLCTSALAYSISSPSVKYRNHIAFYVYFTMLFSGGLVSYYILISKYLHMKNSIWVLIIPSLINPWNMFILRNFFKTLPESLAESARIDGANDIIILFRIVIPLSVPALATIGLFYALAYWNEWFKVILFIDDSRYFTLQYVIMKILRSIDAIQLMPKNTSTSNSYQSLAPAYTSRMAITIVTIGPIILAYPFIQKYFVKGLTVGAVKG